MNTLQITNERQFSQLTSQLDSLADDYREFLTCFVEMKESPYSLEYVYGRLFASKGYFDRALVGLDTTLFCYPLAIKLNGQLQNFFLQKSLLDQRLHSFIQGASQNELFRKKLKAAADAADAKIHVDNFRERIILKNGANLNSLDILDPITALDDVRLHLDERKQLGIEIAFRLQHDQTSLQDHFHQIEQLFWQNLPVLRQFRHEINEYRRRFLIFQDKRFPWWYPERQKSNVKALLVES